MQFHQFIRDNVGWSTREVQREFANPYLEIQKVWVTSPSRDVPFYWTVCHRKGGVAIAAQTADGGFVMIRQERVPIRAEIWEFPAGQIDESAEHDEEAIVKTGLRELLEEAGYELGGGGECVLLQHFLTSPGFTDEHAYVVWAKGVVLSPSGTKHDAAEAISEIRVFSPLEIQKMVACGEIRDANTLCSLAKLSAIGALPSWSDKQSDRV